MSSMSCNAGERVDSINHYAGTIRKLETPDSEDQEEDPGGTALGSFATGKPSLINDMLQACFDNLDMC